MTKVATSLLKNDNSTSNAGNLVGNRMFYDNDYMVSCTRRWNDLEQGWVVDVLAICASPGPTWQELRDDFEALVESH